MSQYIPIVSFVIALVCFAVVLPSVEAKPARRSAPISLQQGSSAPWTFLDPDAGLVFSLKLSGLQSMATIANKANPKNRAAVDLFAFAATTILGWNPFQRTSWTQNGFSPEARVWIQVAGPSSSRRGAPLQFWRTRLIFHPDNHGLALQAMSSMRLRGKIRTQGNYESQLATKWDLSPQSAKQLRRHLTAAGVFLLADPTPLDGIIAASTNGDFIIIDILTPTGKTPNWNNSQNRNQLIQAINRRPNASPLDASAIQAISQGEIGMWLKPDSVAAMISDASGNSACKELQALATSSPFQSVTANVDLQSKPQTRGPKRRQRRGKHRSRTKQTGLSAKVHWHLQPEGHKDHLPWEQLLQPSTAALLLPTTSYLQADLAIGSLGTFRTLAPSPLRWMRIWTLTKRCGLGSKSMVLTAAWPQILAALQREIATIHPSAKQFLDSVGGATLTLLKSQIGRRQKPVVLVEAWVQSPGDAIAEHWLTALFGAKTGNPAKTGAKAESKNGVNAWNNGAKTGTETRPKEEYRTWSNGPIKPYTLVRSGGSIIGAGWGQRARQVAISGAIERHARPANTATTTSIITLHARPSALAMEYKRLPFRPFWKMWKRATLDLTLLRDGTGTSPTSLVLTIEAH